MSKQIYEDKRVICLVGRLIKNELNEYIVVVEDKDNVEEYQLKDILDNMDGSVIKLTSDIF